MCGSRVQGDEDRRARWALRRPIPGPRHRRTPARTEGGVSAGFCGLRIADIVVQHGKVQPTRCVEELAMLTKGRALPEQAVYLPKAAAGPSGAGSRGRSLSTPGSTDRRLERACRWRLGRRQRRLDRETSLGEGAARGAAHWESDWTSPFCLLLVATVALERALGP
jgi:hypothetical protein